MIWVFAIIIFLSLYLGLAGQQADKEEAEIWGKGITKWDYHEIEKGILEIEGECIGLDKIKSFRYKLLFFTLFTTSCCTLFTTVFEIVTAVSAHYSIPIMHIKYSYQETKHII